MKFLEHINGAAGALVAPRKGRVGLNIFSHRPPQHAARSRPARGAWVEIQQIRDLLIDRQVAPRKGRVG